MDQKIKIAGTKMSTKQAFKTYWTQLVMLNRENENIGYREPNIGYSIV